MAQGAHGVQSHLLGAVGREQVDFGPGFAFERTAQCSHNDQFALLIDPAVDALCDSLKELTLVDANHVRLSKRRGLLKRRQIVVRQCGQWVDNTGSSSFT